MVKRPPISAIATIFIQIGIQAGQIDKRQLFTKGKSAILDAYSLVAFIDQLAKL